MRLKWIQSNRNVHSCGVAVWFWFMSIQCVTQRADTMEKVDYAHRIILRFEEKLQVKQLGVHQPQEAGKIQTTGKKKLC